MLGIRVSVLQSNGSCLNSHQFQCNPVCTLNDANDVPSLYSFPFCGSLNDELSFLINSIYFILPEVELLKLIKKVH